MVLKTKTTNPELRSLILELRRKTHKVNKALWRRIADDLERSNRQRRIVNLSRINKYSKENEVVVVPGKVLASGDLNHKLTIAAFSFSKQAVEKIEKAGGNALTLKEIMDKNPEAKNIKIIG